MRERERERDLNLGSISLYGLDKTDMRRPNRKYNDYQAELVKDCRYNKLLVQKAVDIKDELF